uniref:THAP-type domain-containing protein n=1 Tax=Rhipicephalus pulchellus TaxID=72859 RepID=L7M5I7_RHIPC
MPTCFVPGCTSGYKNNPEKRHFFAPPSDPQLLERWVRAIPRADKLLSKTCKVCDVHFMQHDIVKTYKHVIDGQVVEIDRGCWALQPEAVPCQFPNVPSYLSKTIKRRRSPKDRACLPNKVILVATPSVEYQQEVPDPVHNIDFTHIVENGSSLKLPKNWRMAYLEEDTGKPRQVVFYNAGMKDDVYAILKSVAIHEDLTYVIHANGRLLRSCNAEINIFSAQDVEAIIQIVHAKQFCRGCPLIDVTNSSRVTKKVGGGLHHNDCAVLTDADKEVCAVCANFTKTLKRKPTFARSKRKVPVAASALRKRLIRATAARERKKADVKRLSEKLKNTLTATLDDIMKDLPEVQKMAVRAAVMQQCDATVIAAMKCVRQFSFNS